MSTPSDPIGWYDQHAGELASIYEALDPATVHEWLLDLLPRTPALVLDVGAGTGRDAAWLTGLGCDVVAVEPSAAMRTEGQRHRPDAGLRWIEERLPALPATHRLGLAFDAILLSGVWQHVAPGERARAMRKLLGLLRPGGVLALTLTLRNGPAEAGRTTHPVLPDEVDRLAREHGSAVVRQVAMADRMGRAAVSWTGMILRLPDDGTGALPLLRHVILSGAKSSTYKLGLLRALCRAADSQAGMAVGGDEETVTLPLGLVALNWLRLYLPLVGMGLPQGDPATLARTAKGLSRNNRISVAGRLGFRVVLSWRGDRHRRHQSPLRSACAVPWRA